jgi:hypothetical protein
MTEEKGFGFATRNVELYRISRTKMTQTHKYSILTLNERKRSVHKALPNTHGMQEPWCTGFRSKTIVEPPSVKMEYEDTNLGRPPSLSPLTSLYLSVTVVLERPFRKDLVDKALVQATHFEASLPTLNGFKVLASFVPPSHQKIWKFRGFRTVNVRNSYKTAMDAIDLKMLCAWTSVSPPVPWRIAAVKAWKKISLVSWCGSFGSSHPWAKHRGVALATKGEATGMHPSQRG